MGLVGGSPTMAAVDRTADTWLRVTAEPLPVAGLYDWAVRPDCGAVVLFSGTARDHSEGRPDVSVLEYEAYEEHVTERFARIAEETRVRWPDVRCIGIVHKTGRVPVGESSVVVVVSSPHRDTAFDAGRYCIDTLKATAPIWKREVWRDGESWGLDATEISEVR